MTGASAPQLDDTIVALSSAAGPGRRAIVRVTGPDTKRIVLTLFTPDEPIRERLIATGSIRLTDVFSPLPGYLSLRMAPHTYTGQDLAELHLVSSPPLVERLVADLLIAGCRAARAGEFTMRAFLAGKKNLPQAEAVLAVIEARDDSELTEALQQLAGGLTRPLDHLRDDLLNLLADLEAGLDFVEENISFVSLAEIRRRIDSAIHQLNLLRQQIDERAVSGAPSRVVLAGKPNAGKSQLFNALIGSNTAIVSPIAGTTRDYLTHFDRELNAEFVDTAGLDEASDVIEAQAQSLGRDQSQRAELVLHCVPMDETVEAMAARPNVMLIRTKGDLIPNVEAVSAKTGAGIAQLKHRIRERLIQQSRPALAPSLSRCRLHIDSAIHALEISLRESNMEIVALELRTALGQIGELTGTIVTNDLLDRVFSRFCIGK